MNSQAAADVLPIIAEVSVALAASTGIILAFTRDPENWEPFDSIRVLLLLTTSLKTTVFALLPFILFAAGLPDETIWRSLSAMIVASSVGQAVMLRLRFRGLSPIEHGLFRPWLVVPGASASGLNVLAQALNAAGVVFEEGSAVVVLAGLLWFIVVSCFIFVMLIFSRPGTAA